MTPLAWIGALVIGLMLGLLGSGGSILTVPVLVYVVGVPEKAAIAESLAIVGLIASGGVLPYVYKRLVSWSTVIMFSVPGMVGAWLGALAASRLTARVQLLVFAVLMLAAAGLMLRPRRAAPSPAETGRDDVARTDSSPNNTAREDLARLRAARHDAGAAILAPPEALPAEPASLATHPAIETIVVQGFGIGVLTGLVGVGGGFLIVPALVLLVGLPMHMAVGTSLATITLNSAAGFYKHAQALRALDLHLDWRIIAIFATVGIAGSLTGSLIAPHVPQQRLRRVFGVFLVLMAVFLLWENGITPHHR